jgi:hypothetical protein
MFHKTEGSSDQGQLDQLADGPAARLPASGYLHLKQFDTPASIAATVRPSFPNPGMIWKERSQEEVAIRLLSLLMPVIFPWPTKKHPSKNWQASRCNS